MCYDASMFEVGEYYLMEKCKEIVKCVSVSKEGNRLIVRFQYDQYKSYFTDMNCSPSQYVRLYKQEQKDGKV